MAAATLAQKTAEGLHAHFLWLSCSLEGCPPTYSSSSLPQPLFHVSVLSGNSPTDTEVCFTNLDDNKIYHHSACGGHSVSPILGTSGNLADCYPLPPAPSPPTKSWPCGSGSQPGANTRTIWRLLGLQGRLQSEEAAQRASTQWLPGWVGSRLNSVPAGGLQVASELCRDGFWASAMTAMGQT